MHGMHKLHRLIKWGTMCPTKCFSNDVMVDGFRHSVIPLSAYDEVIKFGYKYFHPQNFISCTCNIPDRRRAYLDEMWYQAIQDGISTMTEDPNTGEILAIHLIRIVTPRTNLAEEERKKNLKDAAVLKYLAIREKTQPHLFTDLFKLHNIDKIASGVAGATHEKYQQIHNFQTHLNELSMRACKDKGLKYCTSVVSRKGGRNVIKALGYEILSSFKLSTVIPKNDVSFYNIDENDDEIYYIFGEVESLLEKVARYNHKK